MLCFPNFMVNIQRSCSFQILFKQNAHSNYFGYAIREKQVSVAEMNILSNGGTPLTSYYRKASGISKNKK